jgi:hypothetical protein
MERISLIPAAADYIVYSSGRILLNVINCSIPGRFWKSSFIGILVKLTGIIEAI